MTQRPALRISLKRHRVKSSLYTAAATSYPHNEQRQISVYGLDNRGQKMLKTSDLEFYSPDFSPFNFVYYSLLLYSCASGKNGVWFRWIVSVSINLIRAYWQFYDHELWFIFLHFHDYYIYISRRGWFAKREGSNNVINLYHLATFKTENAVSLWPRYLVLQIIQNLL